MTATWSTAIASVESADVTVRGYQLSELIGRISFVDMVFLVHTGELATDPQRQMLDAIFVTLVEHGISPSSIITRELVSCGSPAQAALAGGVLSIADWHGGSGEELAELFVELLEGCDERSQDAITAMADHLVDDLRDGRPLAGFGHPQHPDGDPRAMALLDLADDHGVAGAAVALLRAVASALERARGKALPPNVTGALAAVLLDLGFSWRAVRGLVIAPRVAGLTAHVVEEMEQGNRWRHAPAGDVDYTGTRGRRLQTGETK